MKIPNAFLSNECRRICTLSSKSFISFELTTVRLIDCGMHLNIYLKPKSQATFAKSPYSIKCTKQYKRELKPFGKLLFPPADPVLPLVNVWGNKYRNSIRIPGEGIQKFKSVIFQLQYMFFAFL